MCDLLESVKNSQVLIEKKMCEAIKKYPDDVRFVKFGDKFDEVFRKRCYQQVDDAKEDEEVDPKDFGKDGRENDQDGNDKGDGDNGKQDDPEDHGGNQGGGNDGVEDQGKDGNGGTGLNVVEAAGCEDFYGEMDEAMIEVFDMHTFFHFHPSQFPHTDEPITSNMPTSSTLTTSITLASPDCPNFSLGLTQEFEGLPSISGVDVDKDEFKPSAFAFSRYMNGKTNIKKNVMVNEFRLSNWLFAMLGNMYYHMW